MPSLTRSARPLLRQVNGLQHALDHDHEPMDEEDYMRDPESSGDESSRPPAASDLEKLSGRFTASVKRKSYGEGDEELFGSAKRQKAWKGPARLKAVAVPQFKPAQESDSDGEIFSTTLSSQSKRSAKPAIFRGLSQSTQPDVNNGNAFPRSSQPRPASSGVPRSQKEPTKTYGARKAPNKVPAHKEFHTVHLELEQPVEQPAKFKGVEGTETFSSSLEEVPSSPPSSPLSPPPDDILDLTGSPTMRVRCEVCRSMVSQTLREEYEDRYNEGKALRVLKQRAFCRYHQQYEAEQEWQQRGYPEIVWDDHDLGKRMRQQHNRLIKILHAQEDSIFKRRLAERIRTRIDRTMAKAMGGDNEVSAGYYGPRGQKVMLEHISEHLAAELRRASTANALIGTAGVGGGVSGFVQSVLVPEMAVGLIAEDMSCSFEEARFVLERSKALGDVLCEELRERVVVDVESGNTT